MASRLEEYRRKRDFGKTAEPAGAESKGARGDVFVVQKHSARNLHYDFRLALDGVLKSWAVPKGPSLDPADKRLAVQTEDHPLEYADFEGAIPKGEYGAGRVIVWDRGRWTCEGDPRKSLAAGKLKFRLEGEKLSGGWNLVRLRGRGSRGRKNNWLLIKERDGAAQPDGASVAGVRLTHADRVLYPGQGVTKSALARYYESIAQWMLPELQDRPTMLLRCPEGLEEECFHQKHVPAGAPRALRRVAIREKTKTAEYLVVDDLAGLVSLVQLGILEIHTWNSRAAQLEAPDRLVFDLDPGPGLAWTRVVEAAKAVRARLRDAGLESFVKTTGGKGLHVVVPLSGGAGWDVCTAFSRRLAESLAISQPRRYTASMSKAARPGKVFIDYLRNARGATSIAAYSTRARDGAPVATPLAWEELDSRLEPAKLTIASVGERLAGVGDPWAGYRRTRQSLPHEPGLLSPAGAAFNARRGTA